MTGSPTPRVDRIVYGPAADPPRGEADDARALVGALCVMLRYRVQIALFALLLPFVVGVVTLLGKRHYTSSSSFVPQTRTQQTNSLAGLAAQFGVQVGGGDQTQSPAFYADVVTSRPVLGTLAGQVFDVPTKDGQKHDTLAKAIAREGETDLRAAALRWLRAAIHTSVASRTGIVTITVVTEAPALSRDLNAAVLKELNKFNLETRQSQATAERAFTQQRLAEVNGELLAAENRMQAFLERNRQYESSPQLKFEYDRLQRDVTVKQELNNSLSQAFEQARIDAVRDTPVFTVVEPPDLPSRPDPRGTTMRVALALIVGLVLGLAIAFTRNLLSPPHTADDPYAELERLRHETRDDLIHPLRALGRARRSNGRATA